MTIPARDAFGADGEAQRRLADLNRPRVHMVAETLEGALCFWRTNGDGTHTDRVRLSPSEQATVPRVLCAIGSTPHRVRGGAVAIRAVEGEIEVEDRRLIDSLANGQASTGNLMARSLDASGIEPSPSIVPGITVHATASPAEYLEARDLTDRIFRNRQGDYAPELDDYNAPLLMPQIAAFHDRSVVAAAGIVIVGDIANLWSVCTDPGFRGRRIAREVVAEACRLAQDLGARHICLGTNDVLSREGGLYHRLGYRTIRRESSWTIRDLDTLSLST